MTDANGWPDPERPGVPLNPERSGWHWVAMNEDPEPAYWGAAELAGTAGWWFTEDMHYGPISAGPNVRYLGLCLNPAEVAAQIAAAVAAERAACEKVAQTVADEGTPDHRVRMAAIAIRDSIRSRGKP